MGSTPEVSAEPTRGTARSRTSRGFTRPVVVVLLAGLGVGALLGGLVGALVGGRCAEKRIENEWLVAVMVDDAVDAHLAVNVIRSLDEGRDETARKLLGQHLDASIDSAYRCAQALDPGSAPAIAVPNALVALERVREHAAEVGYESLETRAAAVMAELKR